MQTEKTRDVTALGELLIDFTENGKSGQGNPLFEANPGGAPCNVLSMLSGLGHKTAFIGKVGDDMFGRMLKERAGAQGIDMTGLEMDKEIPTTLAFVQKLPNGDRDFSFYRKPIQSSRHNDKRPVTALSCFFAEYFIKVKEPVKLSTSADFHYPLIILRSFLGKTIRPIFLHLVR